jgi:hypothetical protein
MKKIVLITLTLSLLLTACAVPLTVNRVDAAAIATGNVEPPANNSGKISDAMVDSINPDLVTQLEAGSSTSALREGEIVGLLFMREEEKLARDVYLTLHDLWNLRIFQNIAKSESTHMEAILTLLDRYGLEDPAYNQAVGEFTNPDLQALYDQLVAQGSKSLSDALKVGAAIEEIDILDLETQIAESDQADIVRVYEQLLKGSRNHLRSFTRTLLQTTGESYIPQYVSIETFIAIPDTGIESGRNM